MHHELARRDRKDRSGLEGLRDKLRLALAVGAEDAPDEPGGDQLVLAGDDGRQRELRPALRQGGRGQHGAGGEQEKAAADHRHAR